MRLSTVFTGWFSVALKEGRTTLVSLRLIIIAAILALAVLGGVYAIAPGGGGGAASKLAYGFAYYPDLNYSRPAIALFVVSPTGSPLAGEGVRLVNMTGGFRVGPSYEVLETKSTNATGWVRFEGLAQRYPNRDLGAVLVNDAPGRGFPYVQVSTRPVPSPITFRVQGMLQSNIMPLGGAQDRQILSLAFFENRGNPISGADVYILMSELSHGPPPPPDFTPPGGWAPYRNGSTDANGYYLRSQPLGSGSYLVRVVKGQLNATTGFGFTATPNPLSLGPDGVLAFVGLLFIPLILPVMALVLGYDAVARERSEGTLDLLLSKPVGRIGVALGKLAGAFGSMAIPVVAVLLAAALLIWGVRGQAPTGSFVGVLLGEALLLLLIFTLIFLAFSSLVRGLGTALLFSILFYLVFTVFWSVISFLAATIAGPFGSVAWYEAVNLLSLFSPAGVYQQLLSRSLPSLGGFVFGGGPGGQQVQALPWSAVITAAVLWTALPLALFLWVMKYRVTEG